MMYGYGELSAVACIALQTFLKEKYENEWISNLVVKFQMSLSTPFPNPGIYGSDLATSLYKSRSVRAFFAANSV